MRRNKVSGAVWIRSIAAVACMALLTFGVQAAPEVGTPTQLDGDVITYTSQTGVMTASGGIKLTQGNAVLTGNLAEYNVKNREALVTGNVKAVKDDATLTAAEIRTYDDMNRLVATGDARLERRDGSATGARLEYQPNQQYAKISGGARLTTRDAVVTAAQAEAFFQHDRATADGNVHIVSQNRNLDAVADHAVYHGISGKNAWAELTGNVRAVQSGAVLTGNHVTLYLDDSAADANGRSRLVIRQPKSNQAPGQDKQ